MVDIRERKVYFIKIYPRKKTISEGRRNCLFVTTSSSCFSLQKKKKGRIYKRLGESEHSTGGSAKGSESGARSGKVTTRRRKFETAYSQRRISGFWKRGRFKGQGGMEIPKD